MAFPLSDPALKTQLIRGGGGWTGPKATGAISTPGRLAAKSIWTIWSRLSSSLTQDTDGVQ